MFRDLYISMKWHSFLNTFLLNWWFCLKIHSILLATYLRFFSVLKNPDLDTKWEHMNTLYHCLTIDPHMLTLLVYKWILSQISLRNAGQNRAGFFSIGLPRAFNEFCWALAMWFYFLFSLPFFFPAKVLVCVFYRSLPLKYCLH